MPARQRRAKGEGSIQKLPNGKYKATITIGRTLEGKQKRRAVTASTRQELLDKIAEIRLKYKVGNYLELQKEERNMTFNEYFMKWLDIKSLSVADNTLRSYKYVFNKSKPLHDIRLNKITNNDINSLLLSLKTEVNAGSLGAIKTVLSTIFNAAIEEELITKSPMKGTVTPAKRQKKVDIIVPTKDNVKAILDEAKKYTNAKWLYPYLLLAVTTGMRKGEIAGLKWSCINFEKNTIKVEEQATASGMSKILKTTSSYREIAVAPAVLKVVNTIEHDDNSKYVFMNKYTSAASLLQSIAVKVREIYDTIGLDEKLTLHSLRHFHATQLIKQGINVKVVSKRLGHSDIKITLDAYVHWLPSMDKEASLLFENI